MISARAASLNLLSGALAYASSLDDLEGRCPGGRVWDRAASAGLNLPTTLARLCSLAVFGSRPPDPPTKIP
jgi:hypothetical protein